MIEINATEEELNDILITAVEGGIGYWSLVADYMPNNGMVSVAEDDKPEVWHDVNLKKIAVGLEVCQQKYPHVFVQWLRDRNGDATTADVIMQCAIFGEAIYG